MTREWPAAGRDPADLDRCRPEKNREIMEGINFLVASGDCVVVLGLARENVEQFLGYSFKNTVVGMSVELLELKPGEVCDADTKPKLYARLYLEKLIQIDVPIPVLREDQARFVISAAPTANNTPLSKEKKIAIQLKEYRQRVENWWRSAFQALDRWSSPVLGSLFLGFVLFVVVKNSVSHVDQHIDCYFASTEERKLCRIKFGYENKPTEIKPAVASYPTGHQPLDPSQRLKSSTLDPVQAIPISSEFLPMVSTFLFLGIAATLLRLALTTRESFEVKDQLSFTQAIEDWMPLIHYVFRSPRALKRYMNRVRFLAMKQRGLSEPDPVSLADR